MPTNSWNLEIQRVELNDLTIDAAQKLGLVIVQPEYNLISDGAVPFQIAETHRTAQIEIIERAFKIRAGESQDRDLPVPFVLFPEASIPLDDPAGLDCLRQQMENIDQDVVFIGGLEGLSPQQAQDLSNRFPSSGPAFDLSFTAGAFVNVCVIAIKPANGILRWYFQSKIRPSQWEQSRNMAHGRRILYFVAPRVAFFCEICFDHIAAQGGEHLNTVLCRQLGAATQPNAASLDFIFVPQNHPVPDHPSARENTAILLNYQDRLLNNNFATVVVVNRAATATTLTEYGRSGFHYREGRWRISTSDLGPKGYSLRDLDGVTSAIFRRRAEAIHVATLVPPTQNTGYSGNARFPLENPRSHLLKDECDPWCACLIGQNCPTGKFLECDCLPCILSDTLAGDLPRTDGKQRWKGYSEIQSKVLMARYAELRGSLLGMGSERARQLTSLLLGMHEEKSINPDLWSIQHAEALVEFIAAMTVLAELGPLDINTPPLWSARVPDQIAIVLLDGLERTHHWTFMVDWYHKTYNGEYYKPEFRRNPVLLVALRSRGSVQPLVNSYPFEITKPQIRPGLNDKGSFAEPAPLRFYVCQDSLFDEAKRAENILEFLKSAMRCAFE
jgi:hypothetical protein